MDLFALSIDVDWAPDFVIETISSELRQYGIKATWFVTHDSPALHRVLRGTDLFEIGIHPNFGLQSSHGETPDQILTFMRTLVPDAVSMRTHQFHQSSRLLALAHATYGIAIDSSLLLPEVAHLRPFTLYLEPSKTPLVRVPVFWEDDVEMYNPAKSWSMDASKHFLPGLKVYTFHPMHVYLNNDSTQSTEKLRAYGPRSTWTAAMLEPFVNRTTPGSGTFFRAWCRHVASTQRRTYTLAEIVGQWRMESSIECHD